ncbi:MAG: transposase [Chlorobium sp.]|nr:transposase [Chlorobium sp.]
MQYRDRYNRARPHSKLGNKTPDEAYVMMMPTVIQAVEKKWRDSN